MSDLHGISTKMKNLALDIYEARTERVARGEEGRFTDVLLEVHDDLIQAVSRLSSLEQPSTVSWDDEVEPPVSARLRSLLDGAKMSVSSLAETAGVSRTTITNILEGETTHPRKKTLAKIEEVFGLEEGELHE